MLERAASPKKILVIMLRRIGDVILTTPALRALKKRFPAAELHFRAERPGAQAVAGDPSIDRLLTYAPAPGESGGAAYFRWLRDVRRERYDWVVDFLGTPRSAILTFASGAPLRAGPAHVWHRWAYNRPLTQSTTACYAGLEKIRVLKTIDERIDDSDFLPRIHVPPDAAEHARRVIDSLWPDANGPLIGLVPASRKGTRQWPAASYGKLASELARALNARVLVFWGPGERAVADAVLAASGGAAKLSPETGGLKDLAGYVSQCRLVVTNCSGPKHVAVSTGAATVTVHGSSDPVSWNPPHPRHVVVRRDELPCIGCRQNDCPLGTTECLRDLEPARVAAAALELLGAPARKA
ncbi:MAG: glycosyltransferase family 9 protein [Elusimicrobia bacterium]|nr:glycosyltransferase family 9 protein [Elusimicrobiota bacterium]